MKQQSKLHLENDAGETDEPAFSESRPRSRTISSSHGGSMRRPFLVREGANGNGGPLTPGEEPSA